MNALDIQAISKTYRSGRGFAVENVDLKISTGDIVALVGESGSGKTTLLRLVAGFEKPDNGTILINGKVVSDSRSVVPPESRQVGMVFQDYALFPHLSVRDNIGFGLGDLDDAEKGSRIKEVIGLMNMSGLLDRYPHHLSGGEQQRVALARALAPRPKLILMDEPFSSLDEPLKDSMRSELRKVMNQMGATVLLVTHDTMDALSTADRIAILRSGRIQQVGEPEELYDRPSNSYVANFFGPVNSIEAQSDSETCTYLLQLFGIKSDLRGSIRFLVRPEDWSIVADQEPGLSGIVQNVNYYGRHWEGSIRITDLLELPPIIIRTARKIRPGEVIRLGCSGRRIQIQSVK